MWWVVILIFFCCLSLSIGSFLLQYYGYCPAAPGLPLSDLRIPRRGAVPAGEVAAKDEGLPASVVERLKSFPLATTKAQQPEQPHSGEDECMICQEDLTLTSVTQLPCQHIFHKTCIRDWLLRKASCPMCRSAVTEENVAVEPAQVADIETGPCCKAAPHPPAAAV